MFDRLVQGKGGKKKWNKQVLDSHSHILFLPLNKLLLFTQALPLFLYLNKWKREKDGSNTLFSLKLGFGPLQQQINIEL